MNRVARGKKILGCFLRGHKWVTIFEERPRIVQQCSRCQALRSTMYDMAYGCTYWVPGDHWSYLRKRQSPSGDNVNRIVCNKDGEQEITFDVTFKRYRKKPLTVFASKQEEPFEVETLEGTMHGDAGDYLVCGIKGEFYPCKPDIFEASYTLVE